MFNNAKNISNQAWEDNTIIPHLYRSYTMKHILLILALVLTACNADPITQDGTTRAVEQDTVPNDGITLKVDTAWAETIVIPF